LEPQLRLVQFSAVGGANGRYPWPNQRFGYVNLQKVFDVFGSAVRICFTLAVAKKLIIFEN
jgi:hypothetical protein